MQFIWLIWSLILLGFWGFIYLTLRQKNSRKKMLFASLATFPLGLTEPLFVPEYWSPPSLFNLALRTGYDIESLLFCFGVGGIAAVIVEWLFPQRFSSGADQTVKKALHQRIFFVILPTATLFVVLILFSSINPIYSAVFALLSGGVLLGFLFPCLWKKMKLGALLFAIFYALYFLVLVVIAPNYVQEVWNLEAVSGMMIGFLPLEELLFALGLGFLWTGLFEQSCKND